MLPRVLNKIFSALVYGDPGQSKDSRSVAVKNVRRHAAALMVKIGNKYPLLLLPVFERIHATVRGLQNDPGQLSKLEMVTLQVRYLNSILKYNFGIAIQFQIYFRKHFY